MVFSFWIFRRLKILGIAQVRVNGSYIWKIEKVKIKGFAPVPRDPSAEGTGRKGASYLDKSLFPN